LFLREMEDKTNPFVVRDRSHRSLPLISSSNCSDAVVQWGKLLADMR